MRTLICQVDFILHMNHLRGGHPILRLTWKQTNYIQVQKHDLQMFSLRSCKQNKQNTTVVDKHHLHNIFTSNKDHLHSRFCFKQGRSDWFISTDWFIRILLLGIKLIPLLLTMVINHWIIRHWKSQEASKRFVNWLKVVTYLYSWGYIGVITHWS